MWPQGDTSSCREDSSWFSFSSFFFSRSWPFLMADFISSRCLVSCGQGGREGKTFSTDARVLALVFLGWVIVNASFNSQAGCSSERTATFPQTLRTNKTVCYMRNTMPMDAKFSSCGSNGYHNSANPATTKRNTAQQ